MRSLFFFVSLLVSTVGYGGTTDQLNCSELRKIDATSIYLANFDTKYQVQIFELLARNHNMLNEKQKTDGTKFYINLILQQAIALQKIEPTIDVHNVTARARLENDIRTVNKFLKRYSDNRYDTEFSWRMSQQVFKRAEIAIKENVFDSQNENRCPEANPGPGVQVQAHAHNVNHREHGDFMVEKDSTAKSSSPKKTTAAK